VLDASRGDIRSHEGHLSHEGNRASAQVATMRTDLVGMRDRAILLIGFSGTFRRSELVALDVADVEVGEDGITVTLRRSKTDQEGAGRKVGIPGSTSAETCPARALRGWRDAASITEGPLFRSVNRHGRVAAVSRTSPSRIAVKASRSACGSRRESVRGSLAPRRPGDVCCDRGPLRSLDHEHDRASVGCDGSAVRARREPVS
jgi:site-specific recombinase XerC